MDAKIINLFDNPENNENNKKKYSELLQRLIAAFSEDLPEDEYLENILNFAIIAWNFGNMRKTLSAQEYENLMEVAFEDGLNVDLLDKMIAYKVKNFSKYSNYIMSFELKEAENGSILKVYTQEEVDSL